MSHLVQRIVHAIAWACTGAPKLMVGRPASVDTVLPSSAARAVPCSLEASFGLLCGAGGKPRRWLEAPPLAGVAVPIAAS